MADIEKITETLNYYNAYSTPTNSFRWVLEQLMLRDIVSSQDIVDIFEDHKEITNG